MAITWITPVEISVGSAGAWTDVDVSAYCPSGTEGVVLHFVNTSATGYLLGAQENASTDNRTLNIPPTSHNWGAFGVDANRVLELYQGNTTAIDVWLVGYFTTDAEFFTNAINKSLTATLAWTDIDISGDTGMDTAIGAVFEVVGTDTNYIFGLQNNASTDNRAQITYNHACMGAVIGVDGSEICEGYISNTAVDFFLVGYITANATFNVNTTNLSLGTTGAWTNLTSLPAGATGGFIEINNTGGTTYYNYGLRKDLTAEDIYQTSRSHNWSIVEAASQIIEGEIANVAVDFFLTGYDTAAPAGGLSIPVAMKHYRDLRV